MGISVGETVGGYRIEGLITDSETVRVFRAVSAVDGQEVALKAVQPGIDDEEMYKRFDREADVASRVAHPNLVSVIDRGHHDGAPYMVMPLIRGRSLSKIVELDGVQPPSRIVSVVSNIGAALDALHHARITHRDVRSSNVIVDDRGTAALTDFGFARSTTDTHITERGRQVGTLDYRAPELFRGKQATAATDIYSLGCVAYECLAGAPPFADRRDFVELGRAHLSEDAPNPKRTDVPDEFVRALRTALAKEPGRRPPSGAAYARFLQFSLPASG